MHSISPCVYIIYIHILYIHGTRRTQHISGFFLVYYVFNCFGCNIVLLNTLILHIIHFQVNIASKNVKPMGFRTLLKALVFRYHTYRVSDIVLPCIKKINQQIFFISITAILGQLRVNEVHECMLTPPDAFIITQKNKIYFSFYFTEK